MSILMSKKNYPSSINNDSQVSSWDVMFGWKFLLGSFDGLPTWKTATVADIVDIFLHHQHQLSYSILANIVKKYCYLWHKLRRKPISQWTCDEFTAFNDLINTKNISFSQSYKIGVYKDTHFAESHLYWIDTEIINYFRHLGFDVAIDFTQPMSSWVTNPIYLKISSK